KVDEAEIDKADNANETDNADKVDDIDDAKMVVNQHILQAIQIQE
ncbi:26987_t:CDS:1, partial [Gigaspora margarita]